MADRNITYLTNVNLITCVLQSNSAESVLEIAKHAGVQGATITYAQGTGIRERMGLTGMAIDKHKEVVRMIVSEEQTEHVFESLYLAGELDKPGNGIMFVTALEKIATYIPKNVLKKLSKA